jgi:hypothetical protein
MRAYRDKRPYVRARFEMSGWELDGIELDGADMTDTHGYADWFPMLMNTSEFALADDPDGFKLQNIPDFEFVLPKVEPHQDPPWLEPAKGFV